MIVVVGIDAGAKGAIASMDEQGNLLSVVDMPVDTVQVGKHSRSRISRVRSLQALADTNGTHAFIERPVARPMRGKDPATGKTVMRTPGAAGMLSFGESFGTVATACVANGMALEEVSPGEWKREVGVPADKDQARRIASERFPAFAKQFARKMDDGRAEAALIALWGFRRMLLNRRK